ncbi:MAG: diguanylate cyclase, partial [Chloroflexota bacterium]
AAVGPAVLGTVALVLLAVRRYEFGPDVQLALAAFGGASAGLVVTELAAILWMHRRLGRITRVAERMAGGEIAVDELRGGGGIDGRLAKAMNAISIALQQTHERATIDRLTGVSNRQTLIGTLFAELERSNRYHRPFSLAFVDIDHFKAVNDTYGHAAGDVVLRGVAQTIRQNLRGSDTMGRYGGEEFMLLLSETNPDEATALTEKLRVLVSRQRFAVDGNQALQVTISIGIAGGVGRDLRVDDLIRDADAAMYSAKSLGRNQTYVFAEPDEDAHVPRSPISPAGRAQAMEIGRLARDAAVASLASVTAPLAPHRGRPSPIVTSIVTAMATQLDLPDADLDRLRIAALVHDIGNITMPDEILDKPAQLTSAEWRTVVQHPRIGQVVLEQAAALKEAAPIILHHHERYSGHGYPFGLRGKDIPLGARILAIADAYDAMTHDRPYKSAVGHQQAIAELRRHAGTQFDPELITLFCELYSDAAPVPDQIVAAIVQRDGPGSARRRIRGDPDRAAGEEWPITGRSPRRRPDRASPVETGTETAAG